MLITAVYIPPDTNTGIALSLLSATDKLQWSQPEGVNIIAGKFYQANLKSVLPKFYKHVSCVTRGGDALLKDFTQTLNFHTKPNKAIQVPYLGQSDNLFLLLTPAYTSLRRSATPVTKIITTWPEDVFPQLQRCFQHTESIVFEHQDLTIHTEAMLF